RRLMRQAIVLTVFTVVFAAPASAQYATEWGTERSIDRISEHVYRWGGGSNIYGNGLFIPTDEGIILIDGPVVGCEPGDSNWIKEELEARYDVPVRYIVLSHDHQSHICGTAAFSDTAVAIGHKKLRPHLIREGRMVAMPTISFDESLDIDLGGVKVTLYYFGPTHSDNLIVTHIPQDGVLFVPDLARPPGQLPLPDFRDLDVDSTIEVLGILSRMDDVELVVPGHLSPMTDQNYFSQYRDYLRSLRERVLTLMVEERSLDEILERVTMSDFPYFENLDQILETNVITMYDYLYRYRESNSPGGMPIRSPQ
ncbi:MAG TPA: MBL fold metallo-hydrolase, partial [Gammaproteobacteria bacterium]